MPAGPISHRHRLSYRWVLRGICPVLTAIPLLLGVANPCFAAGSAPAPAQQTDPESPSTPAPAVVPSAPGSSTDEGALIAGEVALGALTVSAIGVAGYYAVAYQPPQLDMVIPRTTATSNALNLGGLAALIAAPFLAAKVVCRVGGSSADYEGGCGFSVGLAYGLGATAALVAAAATSRPPPSDPGCNPDGGCPTGTSGSPIATLIAYAAGCTIGAVVGWNVSKHRKDGLLAWLQPIDRAGPPRAMLAEQIEWTPAVIQAPLVAFAF
jgi:hypothetical protein